MGNPGWVIASRASLSSARSRSSSHPKPIPQGKPNFSRWRASMKVQVVQINNLRSISFCELTSCGGFNVLIGKNNSGKSNILSAINAFFAAVSDGAIVCLDPLINKEVDFYNKNSTSPAEVTLTFLLDKEEREALLAGLIEDSPQVTNAANSLDSASRLRVMICFSIEPIIYAYVKRISLVSQDQDSESPPDAESVILDVNPDAAQKLYEKYSQYQQHDTRINALRDFLSHVDRDDWMRIHRDFSDDPPGYRRSTVPRTKSIRGSCYFTISRIHDERFCYI